MRQDTILVVDDTPANLGVLFTGLRNAGYKVLLNENGHAALKTALEALPNVAASILVGMPEKFV